MFYKIKENYKYTSTFLFCREKEERCYLSILVSLRIFLSSRYRDYEEVNREERGGSVHLVPLATYPFLQGPMR